MTGRVLTASAVLFGLTSWLPVSSAQAYGHESRGITVAGEAEVKVGPDQVLVTLGVETSSPALKDSKRENDLRVKRVLESIEKQGIESKHVQTEHLSVEPYIRDRFEAKEAIRYVVRRTITVDLRKIDRFEAVLTSSLDAGANYVHGVQFRTTELRKHRDQARTLAVEAAKEKAALLAKSLGRKIGDAISIREDSVGWWSWYGSWWGGRHGSMSQNVVQTGPASPTAPDAITAPGQISVSARVTVTFELE